MIIRQPISIALAEVKSLQHKILALGFILSLLLLLLTYKLANKFSRPIELLADSAHAVEKGQEDIQFEAQTSIREIQGLSQSLQSMTDTLLTQKHQLQDANATLEQKVAERTHELQVANVELAHIARYDALTGLHNRRAFNDYLSYLFTQMSRTQQTYAVLLMDIDFFKKVNDTFGHETGDQVLQRVAEILPTALRITDFVARLGGEEFIALLPATSLDGAAILAEKIRSTIEQEQIIVNHAISLSIGVSVVLLDDTDMNDAIRRADKNLYMAKQQGRNRVIS